MMMKKLIFKIFFINLTVRLKHTLAPTRTQNKLITHPMRRMHKYLPWTARIIVCLLFLISGIAKMFPIWGFEKQLVDLGICGWCEAPYLARLLIGLELAIAIAILQRHYLRQLVIPVTILLLAAFCIHLSIEMYQHGAMNGNCGCFGQLIPMTPLEAFIKNIITIAILVYLYRNIKTTQQQESRITVLLLIYISSAFLLFFFFPFCPCAKEEIAPVASVVNNPALTDTTNNAVLKDTTTGKVAPPEVVMEEAPKKIKSKFSEFTLFENKPVNLDEGKKIVCLFAPGCDHCKKTAKALWVLSQKKGFPKVYILFMNEEANLIDDFFKESGSRYPYQVLDIPRFWKLSGAGTTTPGVIYLWNGNIIRSFEGIEKNEFNSEAILKAIEAKHEGVQPLH